MVTWWTAQHGNGLVNVVLDFPFNLNQQPNGAFGTNDLQQLVGFITAVRRARLWMAPLVC
jgi:hypothetical protein